MDRLGSGPAHAPSKEGPPPQLGPLLGVVLSQISPGLFLHLEVWPCALRESRLLLVWPRLFSNWSLRSAQHLPPPRPWTPRGLAPPPWCMPQARLPSMTSSKPAPGRSLECGRPGRVPRWNMAGLAPPPRSASRPLDWSASHPIGAFRGGTSRDFPSINVSFLSAVQACIPPCGKHTLRSSELQGKGRWSGPKPGASGGRGGVGLRSESGGQ